MPFIAHGRLRLRPDETLMEWIAACCTMRQIVRDNRLINALIFLGVVFVPATVFMIFFFGRLPRDTSGRELLVVLFGAPYAMLIICIAIVIVLAVRGSRQGRRD